MVGVTALDPDVGASGQVVYSLVGGTSYFTIGANTGIITAKRQLTASIGSHQFRVRATDSVSVN